MALDPQQKSRLHEAKLASLARSNLDLDLVDVVGSEWGAVGSVGSRLVALIESRPDLALGRAFGFARRRGCESVDVLCQVGAPEVALRVGLLDSQVAVWSVEGTELSAAESSRRPAPPEPVPEALAFVSAIEAAGARPFVEHGVVVAEVRGLEVGRVVIDEFGPRLVVGVSTDDRTMNEIIHSGQPVEQTLANVADLVRAHRAPGAAPHPFNRLSRERLLREQLVDNPASIGFEWVSPAQPPVARFNLADPCPAVALAGEADDVKAVVVSSVGVDLELVPFAAEARYMLASDCELVVVVPERDAVAFTREMLGRVSSGARLETVADDWFERTAL